MNPIFAVAAGTVCLALGTFVSWSTIAVYRSFSRRGLMLLSSIGFAATSYGTFQVLHALYSHRVLCVRRACNAIITESGNAASYNHHLLGWALLASVTAGAAVSLLTALLASKRAL
ncbi:hypothetical protein UU9_10302 [Rhodanobacter fulvus Jip2]|uniref:Uncharacterized protein n=1 Tax=Rhodanobacter fulvus Jip2 TaxID=1163408 RepID=I4VPI8_9GAMM|nr:hypothetical protein [Rhodanobacter fulvus]EIL89129.1 hypothetical protein UU9_10302 [Rhodanobacter fulvus Jip2]